MRIWAGEVVTEKFCERNISHHTVVILRCAVWLTQRRLVECQVEVGVLNGCGIVGVATAVEVSDFADVNNTIVHFLFNLACYF